MLTRRDNTPTHEKVKEAVRVIREECIGKFQPQIGIICGSGLGNMADEVRDPKCIYYGDIPFLPCSTIKGHEGKFVFGTLCDKPVVLMQGRIHPYEGRTPSECSLPVWIMKELGTQLLIVTAATGALNPEFNVGDIMIIKDHFNSAGVFGLLSPLIGPNDESVGIRFPSLVGMYNDSLRKIYAECAIESGLKDILRSGVYFYACGPAFETVTEAKAFRMLGGDVCGMSIVHETTMAKYLGMDVLGLALVTNKVCIDHDETPHHPTHPEVLAISKKRSTDLAQSLGRFIGKWNANSAISNQPKESD